jgi:hypothetical protein
VQGKFIRVWHQGLEIGRQPAHLDRGDYRRWIFLPQPRRSWQRIESGVTPAAVGTLSEIGRTP